MEKVYIGLGSNLGERLKNLVSAVQTLGAILGDLNFSSVWETEPMLVKDQPAFLNMVVSGLYNNTPETLLNELWDIENNAGRNRNVETPKGPRQLDLDILLFGSRVIKTEILQIPHPAMKERAFVLIPLMELDKKTQDPATNRDFSSYLGSIENQGFICYKNQQEMENIIQGESKVQNV